MIERVPKMSVFLLSFWFFAGLGILEMPKLLTQFTARDAWISGIIIGLSYPIPGFIVYLYQKTFPGMGLFESLCKAFGQSAGTLLNIIVLVWLTVMSAFVLRETGRFVRIQMLPFTPEPLVSAVGCIVVGYSVYKGIETISKSIQFITPILFILIFLFPFGTRPISDYTLLTPILADGWKPVLGAGISASLYIVCTSVLFLFIVPYVSQRINVGRILVFSGAGMALITALIVAGTIAVLGPSISYLKYPYVEAIRCIKIGKFIERIDTLFALYVIIVSGISLAVLAFCLVSSMQKLFRLSTFRSTVVLGMMLLWFASDAFFLNTEYLDEFLMYVLPSFTGVTLIVLPLSGLVFYKIRTMVFAEK